MWHQCAHLLFAADAGGHASSSWTHRAAAALWAAIASHGQHGISCAWSFTCIISYDGRRNACESQEYHQPSSRASSYSVTSWLSTEQPNWHRFCKWGSCSWQCFSCTWSRTRRSVRHKSWAVTAAKHVCASRSWASISASATGHYAILARERDFAGHPCWWNGAAQFVRGSASSHPEMR